MTYLVRVFNDGLFHSEDNYRSYAQAMAAAHSYRRRGYEPRVFETTDHYHYQRISIWHGLTVREA